MISPINQPPIALEVAVVAMVEVGGGASIQPWRSGGFTDQVVEGGACGQVVIVSVVVNVSVVINGGARGGLHRRLAGGFGAGKTRDHRMKTSPS